MAVLESTFLCSMYLDMRKPLNLGETPTGGRFIVDIIGGRVEGRVNGEVLPSGGDWLQRDRDGTRRLDIRAAIRLDDGFIASTHYGGRIVFPADVEPFMTSRAAAAEIDPSRYYFRIAPTFETASEKYNWLNFIQAVGVGRITTTGVAHELYEVL